jgi:hypothetical protein
MTTGRINQVTLVKGTHHELEKKILKVRSNSFTSPQPSKAKSWIRKSSLLSRVLYKHCIASTLSQFSELLKIRSISIAELHPIASLFFSCSQTLKTMGFQSRRAQWKIQLNRHASPKTSGYLNNGYSRVRLVIHSHREVIHTSFPSTEDAQCANQ